MGSIEPTKYTVGSDGKKRAARDAKWRARWRSPDGKTREKWFGRRVDAERWLTSVQHGKLTGSYVDPKAGKVTFRSYAEDWRSCQIHGHGTQVSVEHHLRLHVYPAIGDRPIAAIRPSEIQGLVRRMEETLAASTISVVYGRVVAVFRSAVRDRIVAVSPCVDIRLPRSSGTSEVTEVLEPEQVLALADGFSSRSSRYRALIITQAGLGLRHGELFGLTVDRVDFLRRQVRVDQQIVRVRGEGVTLTPKLKTRAAYRTIPLPEAVAEALAAHIRAFPPNPELGLIFTNERGGPIQQFPFGQAFALAARNARLPDWVTPHDLRHFYASTLIRSGASIKVVQVRLGHESAKTTLDVYSKLFPDEEDRTRVAVDAVLGSSRNTVEARAR